MYLLRTEDYSTYEPLGLEDGLIEWLQFFFFFISSIFAFLIALGNKRINKSIFIIYLLLSLSLIFIALEEISWGQRLFGVESYSIFDGIKELPLLKSNVQRETNLHNFESIHSKIRYVYLAICFYGCFSWLLSFKKFGENVKRFLKYFLIPPILIPYFFFLLINVFDPLKFAPQDFEVTELLLSLGIALFLMLTYRDVRREKVS